MFLGYSVKLKKFFWIGKNLTFYNSFIKKDDMTNLYSCYFELDFPEKNDEYYISLTYPYTYSRIMNLVWEIGEIKNEIYDITIGTLTKSLLSNPIPIITFNNRNCQD